jgi:hypothetical protein
MLLWVGADNTKGQASPMSRDVWFLLSVGLIVLAAVATVALLFAWL